LSRCEQRLPRRGRRLPGLPVPTAREQRHHHDGGRPGQGPDESDRQPLDITAARHNHITTKLREAGLGAIGDLGFIGLDGDPDDPVIITGMKAARKRPLTPAQKEANDLISRERAVNDHAFADLKAWRILAKVRMNARHATDLLRALLVLTRFLVTR
jgi:hypothetical protein